PIATSIVPPLEAFFMKVLSFSLNEELLGAGLSWAAATTAALSVAIARVTIQTCDINVLLIFMTFVPFEMRRDIPAIRNRRLTILWTRLNCGLPALFISPRSPVVRPRIKSGIRDVSRVRTLHARRHVPVAVFDFVNLLHTREGFLPFTHSLVNEPEIVHDLLLHRIH